MSRKNRRVVENVNNLDDLLDLTDSEDNTSSESDTQVFDHTNAFVLELHELKRDELPDNPLPEVKTRKLLKKKKRGQLPTADQSGSSVPSSSVSESSVAPVGTDAKEEFYDAHESYHALPENQASGAVTSVGVAQVLSGHNPMKLTPPAQPPPVSPKQAPPAQPPPLVTAREPSTTVTKPVTPPDQ